MIENINSDIFSGPLTMLEMTSNGSYYAFYELKLRQLLTQNRYRKEQRVRIARQKQPRIESIDNQLRQQRSYEENMSHVEEQSKTSLQVSTHQNGDQKKESDSVLLNFDRTPIFNTKSINKSKSTESRPVSTLKTKYTSL